MRAYDPENLERFTAAFEESVGPVKEMLDSWREDELEVWVHDTPQLFFGAIAANLDGRIEMGLATAEAPRYYAIHELVHWFGGTDSPYENLPSYVEEGLADWIGLELTDRIEMRDAQHMRMGTIAVQEADILAEGAEYYGLPDEDAEATGRLGYEVVKALGLERLRQMAKANASPIDYLNAAEEVSERLKRTK